MVQNNVKFAFLTLWGFPHKPSRLCPLSAGLCHDGERVHPAGQLAIQQRVDGPVPLINPVYMHRETPLAPQPLARAGPHRAQKKKGKKEERRKDTTTPGA